MLDTNSAARYTRWGTLTSIKVKDPSKHRYEKLFEALVKGKKLYK